MIKFVLFFIKVFVSALEKEQVQATKQATDIDVEVYNLQQERQQIVAGGDKARKIQEALSQIV